MNRKDPLDEAKAIHSGLAGHLGDSGRLAGDLVAEIALLQLAISQKPKRQVPRVMLVEAYHLVSRLVTDHVDRGSVLQLAGAVAWDLLHIGTTHPSMLRSAWAVLGFNRRVETVMGDVLGKLSVDIGEYFIGSAYFEGSFEEGHLLVNAIMEQFYRDYYEAALNPAVIPTLREMLGLNRTPS